MTSTTATVTLRSDEHNDGASLTARGGGQEAPPQERLPAHQQEDPNQYAALRDLPPGFPVADPTVSHWQRHAGDSELHDWVHCDRFAQQPQQHSVEGSEQSDDDVELTIVGSGISGALAAYFYLEERGTAADDRPRGKVRLLEARRACSGATGRNGGHCRPDSYAGYLHYSSLFSPRSAHEILANERETFDLMQEVISAEGLTNECEWWAGRSWSLYLDQGRKERGRLAFDAYKDAGHLSEGDGPGQVQWVQDEESAKRMSRVPEAVGGATFEAGSLYPLKFIHAILRICIERHGLELYTHTPVTSILRPNLDGTQRWKVATHRGDFQTDKLLLATNGYSSVLLPSLHDFLTPHRAQCSSIVPAEAYGTQRLDRTYSIGRKEMADYEYLTQRPDRAGGYFILGGGHVVADKETQIGTWDDSQVLPAISDHLSGYCSRTFDGWTEQAQKLGDGEVTRAGPDDTRQGQMEMVWTGIQGYSRDSVPTVGEVPESLLPASSQCASASKEGVNTNGTGLYICGSHHGHGMARAATCSRGIAREMLLRRRSTKQPQQTTLLGKSDESWARLTGLPGVFRWTESRAARRDVDCRQDF